MHFYYTTPKGLKNTPNDEKKSREQGRKRTIRERRKKRLTWLLIFISSILEKILFLVFIYPDRYILHVRLL